MPQPVVAVINSSSVVSDAELTPVVQALQIQVTNHFQPIWGTGCQLITVPKGKKPPEGAWWLVILDDSDVANALGYHDLTNEGLPMSKVFAGTDKHYGQEWSITASHELLEMLGDPGINRVADMSDAAGSVFWAWENCDACEGDQYGYRVGPNGVLVSDFVTPTWFGGERDPAGKYDFCGHIKKPRELLQGGYISIWTPDKGWTMKYAENQPVLSGRAPIGSRRERRRTPKSHWFASTAHAPVSSDPFA